MSNAREKVFPAGAMMLIPLILAELDVRISAFIHFLGQLLEVGEWQCGRDLSQEIVDERRYTRGGMMSPQASASVPEPNC